MDLNVKLIKLLNFWFYNDIIKIIMSYKTFDNEKLIYELDLQTQCDDIYVIGKTLILGNYYWHDKYLDLISKELFTNININPTVFFDEYKTYDKISKNLLCGNTFSLFYKENVVNYWKHINKLRVYKKHIFCATGHHIYRQEITKKIKSPVIVHETKCVKMFCRDNSIYPDFDINDNKFYIFDSSEKKITMYEILDDLNLKFLKHVEIEINNEPIHIFFKIFTTNEFTFLYLQSEILIFYDDLTFFRKLSLPFEKLKKIPNRGFYVENNIIYLINNNRIKIFELY
jgi:hypothetical protein